MQKTTQALARLSDRLASARYFRGVAATGGDKAWPGLTSSPTFALRVSGGGFPLLGGNCSHSTWFLLHRAA